MRRLVSIRGLAVAVWVSSSALGAVLIGMAALGSWHPHFLPVMPLLALVMVAALALIVGAAWGIARGPARGRAVSWLLIGVAPIWFLTGYFLHGYATTRGRNQLPDPWLRPLIPLGDAVMDVEARFRYPQRIYGEKVVAISAPIPEGRARAETAAMDRHIRKLEARLGRPAGWAVHWARGPILGAEGKTHRGFSIGVRPGEWLPDAEGLSPTDRHEVAHALIASLCPPETDPPAVLVEGWAEANMGNDPVVQALGLKQGWDRGQGPTLRQLTGPGWYHRHQGPAYAFGAPMVDFLLRKFGPASFLRLYTTCREATFDADCRRILGLDVDGLDAALRAEIDRSTAPFGSLDRYRLEHLPIAPGIALADWRAFLAEYFASADRLLAANRHVRLSVVRTREDTDARGQTERSTEEQRSLRSGDFASLRHVTPYYELAYLAHPRRSISARRNGEDRDWRVEGDSRATPEEARRRTLYRIDLLDAAGSAFVAPLLRLSGDLNRSDHVLAAFDRLVEDGQARVRVRIEDRSPANEDPPWRSVTYVLDAEDHLATRTERAEGVGPGRASTESTFTYDRHEALPVLRSIRSSTTAPDGSRGAVDLEVVDRRFGPIPESEFDPDRFLGGPQVIQAEPEPFAEAPSELRRRTWIPFAIGGLCLIAGAAISIGSRRRIEAVATA